MSPAVHDQPTGQKPVVMVEWLGRGGFAHTAEAWVREARARGLAPTVVTRAGRELALAVPDAVVAGGRGGPVVSHVAVVSRAMRVVRAEAPGTVVLHGSVVPQLELQVVRAAHHAGSRVVLVAHESAIARRSPGATPALAALVRGADVVVAHSRFVAGELTQLTGRRDIRVVPLPLLLGLLDHVGMSSSVLAPTDEAVALHFGHLHRGYKGSATVLRLAKRGVPGWHFALVGKGAPQTTDGIETVGRFLDASELVATVAGSDATVLPYSRASQSGAIVLAQALGTVAIASAVGGIPEQIDHGVTGWLVAPDAPDGVWLEALAALTDPAERHRIATAARTAVHAAHAEFVSAIIELLA